MQKTWNSLASNELLFKHSSNDAVKKLFLELTSTSRMGDKNLEFIVYTFSEMIRGELSYFAIAPEKFCSDRVVQALLQAQERLEMNHEIAKARVGLFNGCFFDK